VWRLDQWTDTQRPADTGDQYGGCFELRIRAGTSEKHGPGSQRRTASKPVSRGPHGLLYWVHSLYVMVNDGHQKGISASCGDTDGRQSNFEPAEMLVPIGAMNRRKAEPHPGAASRQRSNHAIVHLAWTENPTFI